MGRRRAEESTPDRTSQEALAALLATEEQLDARLAAARVEAQRIIDESVEAARRASEGCAALIESRSAALTAAIDDELRQELRAIAEAAERTIAHLDAVDPARSPELVELVVSRVLSVADSRTRS